MEDYRMEQLLENIIPKLCTHFQILTRNPHSDEAGLVPLGATAANAQPLLHLTNWVDFLKNHESKMTSSSKMYVTYVLYGLNFIMQKIEDAYDRFFTMLAVVTMTMIYFQRIGQCGFVPYTSKIVSVFFNEKLKRDFYKRGGWDKLLPYILNKGELTYEDVMFLPYEEFDPEILTDSLKKKLSVVVLEAVGNDVEPLNNLQINDIESDSFCQTLANMVAQYQD